MTGAVSSWKVGDRDAAPESNAADREHRDSSDRELAEPEPDRSRRHEKSSGAIICEGQETYKDLKSGRLLDRTPDKCLLAR